MSGSDSSSVHDDAHAFYEEDFAEFSASVSVNELRAAGLAGTPTSWQYDEWVRRRKLKATKRGGGGGRTLRLPYARNISRLFPQQTRGWSRWHAIVDTAGLDV